MFTHCFVPFCLVLIPTFLSRTTMTLPGSLAKLIPYFPVAFIIIGGSSLCGQAFAAFRFFFQFGIGLLTVGDFFLALLLCTFRQFLPETYQFL